MFSETEKGKGVLHYQKKKKKKKDGWTGIH